MSEHADLRLFSVTSGTLAEVLSQAEGRQLRWAETDNPPSHIQIFELKASYPVNSSPAETDNPSKPAIFPNL